MTQNRNELKKDAGEIELKDSIIELTDNGKLLSVNLNDKSTNFFVRSKDVDINISFTYDHGIHITAWQDKGKTEIKKIKFESITKHKVVKIKLNELLNAVKISGRV